VDDVNVARIERFGRPVLPCPPDASHLAVLRESDHNNFSALKSQKLRLKMSGVPGADVVRDIGAEPLRYRNVAAENSSPRDAKPSDGRIEVLARITAAELSAVLYRVLGTNTYVLVALGSAAKTDAYLENAFTNVLAGVITEYDITHVYAPEVSRLVRSVDFASAVIAMLQSKRITVKVETRSFCLWMDEDRIDFYDECVEAAKSASLTKKRTDGGSVAHLLSGEAVGGPTSAPAGLKLEDGSLVWDEDFEGILNDILRILAREDLTDVLKRRELGMLGLTGPSNTERGQRGWHVGLAGTGNVSAEALHRLRAALPMWRDRRYTIRRTVRREDPIQEIEILTDSSGTRFVEVQLPDVFPDRPIGDAKLIAKAIEVEDLRRASVRTSSHDGLPLLAGEGRAADWGHHHLLLQSQAVHSERHYWLGTKKPSSKAGVKTESRTAALLHRDEFHRGVAVALAKGLTEGVPSRRLSKNPIVPGLAPTGHSTAPKPRPSVVERLANNRVAKRNLRALTKEIETDLGDSVRAFADEYAGLEAQGELLLQQLSDPSEFTGTVVFAEPVYLLAKRLIATDADMSALERRAFASILVDMSYDLGVDHVLVHFFLRLPVNGDAEEWGPFTAVVPNHARPHPDFFDKNITAESLTRRWLMGDDSVATLSGVSGEERRDSMEQLLREKGAAEGSAQAATRHFLDGEVSPEPFAQHVHRSYRLPFTGPLLGKSGMAERAVRYLRDVGGAAPAAEVARVAGYAKTAGLHLALSKRLAPNPLIRDVPHPDGARWVGLVPCPHFGCSGLLDTVLRMPEVPSGVLCSQCRRMPVPDSVVFPESYLHLHHDEYQEWRAARWRTLRTQGRTSRARGQTAEDYSLTQCLLAISDYRDVPDAAALAKGALTSIREQIVRNAIESHNLNVPTDGLVAMEAAVMVAFGVTRKMAREALIALPQDLAWRALAVSYGLQTRRTGDVRRPIKALALLKSGADGLPDEPIPHRPSSASKEA
jgi:hypothetical protein